MEAEEEAVVPRPKWWLLHVLNYFFMGVFVVSVAYHISTLGGPRRDASNLLPLLLIWSCCMAYFFGFFGISFVDHEEDLDYFDQKHHHHHHHHHDAELEPAQRHPQPQPQHHHHHHHHPRDLDGRLPTLLEDDSAAATTPRSREFLIRRGARWKVGDADESGGGRRRLKVVTRQLAGRFVVVLGSLLVDEAEREVALARPSAARTREAIARGARALRLAGGARTHEHAASKGGGQHHHHHHHHQQQQQRPSTVAVQVVASDSLSAAKAVEACDRMRPQLEGAFARATGASAVALDADAVGRVAFLALRYRRRVLPSKHKLATASTVDDSDSDLLDFDFDSGDNSDLGTSLEEEAAAEAEETEEAAALAVGSEVARVVAGGAFVGAALVASDAATDGDCGAEVTIPGAVVRRSLGFASVDDACAAFARADLAKHAAEARGHHHHHHHAASTTSSALRPWADLARLERAAVVRQLCEAHDLPAPPSCLLDITVHLEAVNSGKDLYASVAMPRLRLDRDDRHHHPRQSPDLPRLLASVLLSRELGALANHAKPTPSKARCGLRS